MSFLNKCLGAMLFANHNQRKEESMAVTDRTPNDDRSDTFNPCAPGYNPPPYDDCDDDEDE